MVRPIRSGLQVLLIVLITLTLVRDRAYKNLRNNETIAKVFTDSMRNMGKVFQYKLEDSIGGSTDQGIIILCKLVAAWLFPNVSASRKRDPRDPRYSSNVCYPYSR